MFHVYLSVFKSLVCICEISICTHSNSKSTAETEKKHTTTKMTVFLLQRIHVLYFMFIKFLRWRVICPLRVRCNRYLDGFIFSSFDQMLLPFRQRQSFESFETEQYSMRFVIAIVCYAKPMSNIRVVLCVCMSYLCILLSISEYLELYMQFSRSKSAKQLIQ